MSSAICIAQLVGREMVGASLDGRTADVVEVEWDALGKIEKPSENYVGTVPTS